MTFDLGSAAEHMAELVGAVPPAALDRPTPAGHYTVAALLDHIGDVAESFTLVANKAMPADRGGVAGDAAHLAPDWQASIPAALDGLAVAWRQPAAWEGTTRAGGIELPADAAAVVAVEELTIHGWDLARAVGLPFSPAGADIDIALRFLGPFAEPGSADQRGTAFAPAIFLDDSAPLLDRAVALSGRDVGWTPPAG